MPTYRYKVLRADGATAEGELEAASRPDAFHQLDERGWRALRLDDPRPAGAPAAGRAPPTGATARRTGAARVSGKARENFTRSLSNLLAAGVPLSKALTILHTEAATPAAAVRWKEIHDRVVDGKTLADAMAESPDVFPRVYTAMVHAGETGGFLDTVLAQIADFQSREKDLRAKVTTALLYPAILVVLALSVLVFLLVFFIPRFQKLFAGFGGTLPLVTRAIIGASRIAQSYGFIVLAALLLGIYLLRAWFASERGRRVWEGWILRLPVIGRLAAAFAMARFCRMLGTLLGAGVPLVHGLNVARQSIGNQLLSDAVAASIARVQEGGRLGQSLADCPALFPKSVLEMVSVAEETGRLAAELVRIASVTESDLDRQLKTAVAFAEPLMLFVVAGFIGTIFIGMLLPIFTLQQYIK